MADINMMSGTIKRVMSMYGVHLEEGNEHGINDDGFAIIMATELFKELRGIGKPAPARRSPLQKAVEAVSAK
jgi:hypothetical protein